MKNTPITMSTPFFSKGDLNLYCFRSDTPDADLDRHLKYYYHATPDADVKLFWFMNQWDHDPRELWQIPKAKALAQRLIDTGWLAVLEPMPPANHGGPVAGTGGFLYAIANGCFVGRQMRLPMDKFRAAIEQAKQLCDRRFGQSDGRELDPTTGSGGFIADLKKPAGDE